MAKAKFRKGQVLMAEGKGVTEGKCVGYCRVLSVFTTPMLQVFYDVWPEVEGEMRVRESRLRKLTKIERRA